MTDITTIEITELSTCEAIIERGLKTFYEVGDALQTIRDKRLYRVEFATFEEYCKQRWNIAHSRASQLMNAAHMYDDLKTSTTVEVILPRTESQARPLACVEPEHRAEVWQQAVDTAPEGRMTAAHVERTVEEYKVTRTVTPEQKQAMSDRMIPKFARLHELEEQGIYIGSVWSFDKRADYAGDGKYHGNSIPQVVENAVLLYTKEGETVLDPMAGSGTTVTVCKMLKRRCIAMDIQPENTTGGVLHGDAMHVSQILHGELVDMIFWHPPYWNMVVYSHEHGDISNTTWPGFIDACHNLLAEFYKVLKIGGHIIILSGDKVQGGEFYPVSRTLANMAESIGFVDRGVAIKTTINSTSQIVKGKTIWAELAYTNNLKVSHDTINIFSK